MVALKRFLGIFPRASISSTSADIIFKVIARGLKHAEIGGLAVTCPRIFHFALTLATSPLLPAAAATLLFPSPFQRAIYILLENKQRLICRNSLISPIQLERSLYDTSQGVLFSVSNLSRILCVASATGLLRPRQATPEPHDHHLREPGHSINLTLQVRPDNLPAVYQG
ncbi:hypothetical protein OPQ81_000200 [Rhizoctonia solani]|nr:hypothetical protein OPQ81_000200 [Rhizoctonia solani]